MPPLRELLLSAYESGTLVQEIGTVLSSGTSADTLASELVTLHNEGHIDALNAFGAPYAETGIHGTLTRQVFEKTLPNLDAPVEAVMRCIHGRYATSGKQALIGTALDRFSDFCTKEPSRPQAVVAVIDSAPDSFAYFLPCAVSSGTRINKEHFLREAVRLTTAPNAETRRQALLSLRFVQWEKDEEIPDFLISTLEHSTSSETDDGALANAIRSAFDLLQKNASLELRIASIVDSAISNGGELALRAGAYLFAFHTKDLSQPILDLLQAHLKRVHPLDTHTLNLIDHGLTNLLNEGSQDIAIQFFEELLLGHAGNIDLDTMHGTIQAIRDSAPLLSRVVTQWLMDGAYPLCLGVEAICRSQHIEHQFLVELDAEVLSTSGHSQFLFVAEKTIGHFFLNPITAGSIVVSLIRISHDDKTRAALGGLLFDPLLLNYTGKLRDFLTKQCELESGKTKEVIAESLSRINCYLDALNSVPQLPALHPSESQRNTYRQHMSDTMQTSMKAAERKSVLFDIFERSTLLYSDKAINYVFDAEGKPHRTEMPLGRHGVSMEMPRMHNLDPIGTDFKTLTLRSKKKSP